VPVCVVDDERSIGRFSRFTTHAVRVADLRDEDRTVETVLDVGSRLGLDGWVLFPTREETVAAFSRRRTELSRQFRVPTPGWDTVRWAWDKRNTYRLAEELGIPAPRTWYPQRVEDLAQVDGDPPFALKPAIKEHFVYATRAKAWRVDSRAELAARFRQAVALVGPGEMMVQELVPGGGSQQFAYCSFFRDGVSVASMVARRSRQHPPEFGRASTYVETVELPVLEAQSQRLLRAIDYYGLVELEYKLDPRDGHYKLLDVNARAWGYHSLGRRAGVDFPYLLYADQLGAPVTGCRARPGVRWIRLLTDVPTAVYELAHGRLDGRRYLRSLADFDVEAVFSWRDPLPALAEALLLPYLVVKRGF
jgi:predicted ATP-grasp superfamily ATP-dependent carboligase